MTDSHARVNRVQDDIAVAEHDLQRALTQIRRVQGAIGGESMLMDRLIDAEAYIVDAMFQTLKARKEAAR